MTTDKIKDGGPAFPFGTRETTFDSYGGSRETTENGFHGGMSLRDWFAGQALPVILQRWMDRAEIEGNPTAAAYQVADDMLKAREASNA